MKGNGGRGDELTDPQNDALEEGSLGGTETDLAASGDDMGAGTKFVVLKGKVVTAMGTPALNPDGTPKVESA